MISQQEKTSEVHVISEPTEMKSSIQDTVAEATTTAPTTDSIALKVDNYLSDLERQVQGRPGRLYEIFEESRDHDNYHVKLLKKRNFVTLLLGKPELLWWKEGTYVMLNGRVQATTFRDFVIVAAFYTDGDNRWFLIATQNLNGDYFCSGRQPHPSIAARKANDFLREDVGGSDVMKICDGEGCLAFGMSQREFFQIVAKQEPFKEAFASFRLKENPRFPRDKPAKRERSPPATETVQEQEQEIVITVGRPKRVCAQRPTTLRAPSPPMTPKAVRPYNHGKGKGKGHFFQTIEPNETHHQDTQKIKPTETIEAQRALSGFTNMDIVQDDSFFHKLVGEPEVTEDAFGPYIPARRLFSEPAAEGFSGAEIVWSAEQEGLYKMAPLSSFLPDDFAATFGATRSKSGDLFRTLPK